MNSTAHSPSTPPLTVVHILYSGVGGLASVGLDLAKVGSADSRQIVAFYGVEPVAEANAQRANEIGIPWRGFLKKPGLSLDVQREMAAWMAEFQPDAVVAHSLAVLYAARQVRKTVPKLKILAVEHHANALKSAKRWVLSLLSFWLADHVVYLSQNYVEELRRKIGPLFRERKAATIPNGLDLAAYKPSVGHARGFTVGMQGRFIDSKDFPTLIKALAVANKLPGPPLHLELAGDGPRREEFTTLVAELGQQEHVSFLGLLDHASLLSHMHHWNAYAHATFGETMSIALMEASACALPIVTNDAPGVSTWFRPGLDGLLTPIGDAEAMGQALRKLANDPAYCASLGQAALQVAQEKYSAARAWADYRKLITAS